MRNTAKFLAAGALALLLATGASSHVVRAQAPPQQPPAQPSAGAAVVPQQQPTFRVSVDLVTTDAIPRDERTQQFIADLKPGEFEIFEDGVKQNIVSMELIHGGRAYSAMAPPPAPVSEGIILPRSKPTNDAAGRVFLVFIDDLHLDFNQTPRLRTLLKDMVIVARRAANSDSLRLMVMAPVLEWPRFAGAWVTRKCTSRLET